MSHAFGSLAVALVVIDSDGKVRATVAPTLTLGLRPESYRQIAESGTIRVISQFALPPGRYQLRAALAAAPNNSGCVQYDLELPDFTKTRMSLSSVALTSQKASLSPAVVDKHVDDHGMLAITSIYVRYLLPMMCEIQWWDYHEPAAVPNEGENA